MERWEARDRQRDQKGDPRELGGPGGVTLWDNAYRSGDYVGRNLWRTDESCSYVWDPPDWRGSNVPPVPHQLPSNSTEEEPPPPSSPPPQAPATQVTENVRLAFCIGAGAHH